ncbi:MAG TPA: hypothetical protein VF469_35745, partial [Kofleriaceae bacterium]
MIRSSSLLIAAACALAGCAKDTREADRKALPPPTGSGAPPLPALPALANRLGVGEVRIKDESQRFGFGAFKALGGVLAVYD